MNLILDTVLRGSYSYKRTVSSPNLNFCGTALFETVENNRIIYTEHGSYILQEKEYSYYQKRFFVATPLHLYIYKSDHTLLHEFTFTDDTMEFPLQLTNTHFCRNDRYFLTLTFHSLDNFSMSYVIQGPFKSYTMHTIFSRLT